MSEGELKKRILYAGKPFLDFYWEYKGILQLHEQNVEIHPDPTCEYLVEKMKVDKILDEAKQEYPVINREFIEGKITKEVLFSTLKARDEWFKKYFGSAEK